MSELQTINRHAIVALPTEAFLQWFKASPVGEPDYTMKTVRGEQHYAQCVFRVPSAEARGGGTGRTD